MSKYQSKESGFTLIEMAIVLTVIALIITSVIGGRNLITAARIKAQIEQLKKYESAYYNFKLKFNEIPGDMANFTNFYSGSVNGDGNGRITHEGDNAHNTSYENIKFFEQLSRSGIIGEQFTNTWTLGVGYPKLALNPNKGMVAAGFVSVGWVGTEIQLSENSTERRYTCYLDITIARPEYSNSSYNDQIGTDNPGIFAALDNKFDDGIARTGKFMVYRSSVSLIV